MNVFGTVVEADGVSPGIITIKDGVITGFIRTGPDVLTLTGNRYNYALDRFLIFPGFIDIHTHCREDVTGNENHKEDYGTVGLAAISGGVTYIADMPDNPVQPTTLDAYDAKRRLTSRCPVDVLCYGGVGPNTHPFGRVPYKVFMGTGVGDLFFKDHTALAKTLERYRGQNVSFHCEDPTLLDLHKHERNHEHRRPPMCEYTAIEVAINFIKDFNLTGKICHVSTAQGLDLIIKAKAAGVNVTCEVTPHHLFFDAEMITHENRRFLQMNPPLRRPSDRKHLLEAVRNGNVDFLATDHTPHTTHEKLRGISGVPQLDTYGSFVAWLVKEQHVDPLTIFKMACKNPGEWVGSFTGRKIGRIQSGYEASVTILDMTKPPVDGRPLYTKCNWSPFDLRTLPGTVQTVFLKGEKVVDGLFIKSMVLKPGVDHIKSEASA